MCATRRALIIEDLEVAQKVAVNILSALGYQIHAVHSGVKALELIIRHHYDLLLLDLHLPDMDGFEVSQTVRGLEREGKHMTIVALTAHDSDDLDYRCYSFGIDSYIVKPLTIEKARYVLGSGKLQRT